MKIPELIRLAAVATTLREVDWIASQFTKHHGEAGVDALINVLLTELNWRKVARVMSVLGSMHIVETPKVAAALERVLLTRQEVELHKLVLPGILIHSSHGREDATLALANFTTSGGTAAMQLVQEAFEFVERTSK